MLLKELPKCPVETTLKMIGKRWKIIILRELLAGTMRFGELKKAVSGISQKVLTANLRQMEEDGLVVRQEYKEVPPRVDYTLTDVGYSLASVLDAMADWGEGYRQFLKLVEKQNKKSKSLENENNQV